MLGDTVVDAALAPMREKLAELSAEARPTEEQRKQVTVLFADLSTSAAMSGIGGVSQAGDRMSALWRRIDAAITAHGGTIDKHVGDAVMALWGVDQARALNGLGAVALNLAEYEKARSCLSESLALGREIGDRMLVGGAQSNLGEVARHQEDYTAAQRHYGEALGILKEIGAQLFVAINHNNLGHVAIALGDESAARRYYGEAIQMGMAMGATPTALEDLAGLAGAMAHTGQVDRALELLGLVQHHPALLDETRSVIAPILAGLRAKLPPRAIEAALARGRSLALDQVVAEILEQVGLG